MSLVYQYRAKRFTLSFLHTLHDKTLHGGLEGSQPEHQSSAAPKRSPEAGDDHPLPTTGPKDPGLTAMRK